MYANIVGDHSLESLSDASQSMCSSLSKFKDYPPKEYEELIQKLEGDIRMHIRVEQQMRLHIENLQQKIEDLEREFEYSFKKTKSELIELKAERNKLKEQIDSRDDQMRK